jgi:hypothetical protein
MLKLFVAARSRHKAVCGPQGIMRSQENGWSCFSGDVGRRNGPESWFYVDPLQMKRTVGYLGGSSSRGLCAGELFVHRHSCTGTDN